MNGKIVFQVLNFKEQTPYEDVWDFDRPGQNYTNYILWIANDTPHQMRILCDTQELYDSFFSFWDGNSWPRLEESLPRPSLFKDGDIVWSALWANGDRSYIILAPIPSEKTPEQ